MNNTKNYYLSSSLINSKVVLNDYKMQCSFFNTFYFLNIYYIRILLKFYFNRIDEFNYILYTERLQKSDAIQISVSSKKDRKKVKRAPPNPKNFKFFDSCEKDSYKIIQRDRKNSKQTTNLKNRTSLVAHGTHNLFSPKMNMKKIKAHSFESSDFWIKNAEHKINKNEEIIESLDYINNEINSDLPLKRYSNQPKKLISFNSFCRHNTTMNPVLNFNESSEDLIPKIDLNQTKYIFEIENKEIDSHATLKIDFNKTTKEAFLLEPKLSIGEAGKKSKINHSIHIKQGKSCNISEHVDEKKLVKCLEYENVNFLNRSYLENLERQNVEIDKISRKSSFSESKIIKDENVSSNTDSNNISLNNLRKSYPKIGQLDDLNKYNSAKCISKHSLETLVVSEKKSFSNNLKKKSK